MKTEYGFHLGDPPNETRIHFSFFTLDIMLTHTGCTYNLKGGGLFTCRLLYLYVKLLWQRVLSVIVCSNSARRPNLGFQKCFKHFFCPFCCTIAIFK